MLRSNIRMIGLDLDGTVYNDAKEITRPVREAIEAAIRRGVVVLPATGRPATGLPEAFLNIPGVRYALTSNGAAIVDLSCGEQIYEDCLEPAQAAKIMEKMLEYRGLAETYMDGRCYSDRTNFENAMNFKALPEAMVAYIRKSRILVDRLPEFILEMDQPVEKLHMIFGDMDIRRQAFDGLCGAYPDYTITSAAPFNMEINSPTCNKGSGLIALGKLLGIKREEIMACGDSGNDYPMICAAGLSVAMGNAQERIKAAADFVTKTNEEDGVAYAIRKFVLEDQN